MERLKQLPDFINKYIVSAVLIGLLSLGGISYFENDDISNITYDQLIKLKPVVVIDQSTLLYAGDAAASLNNLIQMAQLTQFLASAGIKPFHGKHIPILINSNGGRVDFGFRIIGMITELKKYLGVTLECHVQRAYSMAFTLMLSICDNKIGLKDVQLMQHQAKMGDYNTIGTKQTDLFMSSIEAQKIGMDHRKWIRITREQGDKYFSEEEMIKYKLLDSINKKAL